MTGQPRMPKQRLRAAVGRVNTSVTEVVRRAATTADAVASEAAQRFVEQAMADQRPDDRLNDDANSDKNALVLPIDRAQLEHALAHFLLRRDLPQTTPEKRLVLHYPSYRSTAAAILDGEAWAIRKAWPEAAREITHTRDV